MPKPVPATFLLLSDCVLFHSFSQMGDWPHALKANTGLIPQPWQPAGNFSLAFPVSAFHQPDTLFSPFLSFLISLTFPSSYLSPPRLWRQLLGLMTQVTTTQGTPDTTMFESEQTCNRMWTHIGGSVNRARREGERDRNCSWPLWNNLEEKEQERGQAERKRGARTHFPYPDITHVHQISCGYSQKNQNWNELVFYDEEQADSWEALL